MLTRRVNLDEPHAARLTIVSEVRQRAESASFQVRIDSSPTLETGRKLTYRTRLPGLQIGDVLESRLYLQEPHAPRNPGEFDFRRYLKRQGINYETRRIISEEIKGRSLWWGLRQHFFDLRDASHESLIQGMQPDSAATTLIPAVALGLRPDRTNEVLHDFRQIGALHLFAVSGLHVGILVIVALFVLRWMRVHAAHAPYFLIPLVIGYAAVTGFPPAAVRAALMASVYFAGRALYRPTGFANAMALSAVIILVVDTHQLFSIGFQLSFFILTILVAVTTVLEEQLRPKLQPDPFLPRSLWSRRQQLCSWFTIKAAGLLIVSIIAWLASIPLVGGVFRIFTPISIVASFLLTLPVALVLSLATISLPSGIISPTLQRPVNALNEFAGNTTSLVARKLSRSGIGSYDLRRLTKERERLIIYDLGKGRDCIATGAGGGLVIDSGDAHSYRQILHESFRDLDLTAPTCIITHPANEAYGGFDLLFDFYFPKQVIVSAEKSRSPGYRSLLGRARARKAPISTAIEGEWQQLSPDFAWRALNSPQALDGEPVTDERTLILEVRAWGHSILLLGDSDWRAQAAMLERHQDLKPDIIVYGQNSRSLAPNLTLLKTLRPTAIIYANSAYPSELYRDSKWNEPVEAMGITCYDQLEHGAIIIDSDGITGFLTTR